MDCKTHLQSCKKSLGFKWLDSWTNLDALVVPSLQIVKELFVFIQILIVAPKPKGVFFAFCVLSYASSY